MPAATPDHHTALKARSRKKMLISGAASSTSWPKSVQSFAASSTALTQSAWIGTYFLEEGPRLGRRPVRIAYVGPRRSVEQRGTVANAAGDRVLAHESAHHVTQVGSQRIARSRRLQPKKPAA